MPIFTADLWRQLAKDRCSFFSFLGFLLLGRLFCFFRMLCFFRGLLLRNFESRNLALKTFFANTRNMAYNEQSPWTAVILQLFCLVFFCMNALSHFSRNVSFLQCGKIQMFSNCSLVRMPRHILSKEVFSHGSLWQTGSQKSLKLIPATIHYLEFTHKEETAIGVLTPTSLLNCHCVHCTVILTMMNLTLN